LLAVVFGAFTRRNLSLQSAHFAMTVSSPLVALGRIRDAVRGPRAVLANPVTEDIAHTRSGKPIRIQRIRGRKLSAATSRSEAIRRVGKYFPS
jgi:hypothetical protein